MSCFSMNFVFVLIFMIILVLQANTEKEIDTEADKIKQSDTESDSENELELNENNLKAVLPDIENFKKKYKALRKQLRKIKRFGFFTIKVERKSLFVNSFERIIGVDKEKLLKKWMQVKFLDDIRPGLLMKKEWFSLISEAMHPPFQSFLRYTDENNKYWLEINPITSATDWQRDYYKDYYRFFARVVALAILHGKTLNVPLIKPFYMNILKKEIQLKDIEIIDPELYESLTRAKENPKKENLTFAVYEETNRKGEKICHDLKTNGHNIKVTKKVVDEYIDRYINWKYKERVEQQMSVFLKEFNEIIPLSFFKDFDEKELEILIGGIRQIDVNDWEKNTLYIYGYQKDSEIIKWFWKIIRSFTEEQKMKILEFVTGTSVVPEGGFRKYYPFLFTIVNKGNTNEHPQSDTTFRQFWLPPYESEEKLKEELIYITNTQLSKLYQKNPNNI